MISFGNDWDMLVSEFEKEYYQKLRKMLTQEYKAHTVYPDMYDIYNALKLTPYCETRVVILGQDPYHGPGQAHGLAFSVKKGIAVPPSLQNIYKELKSDLGIEPPGHGCLEQWAKRGVLLLNAYLTVRAGNPMSHKALGWEKLTDSIIQKLGIRDKPMVFMLWGSFAKAKAPLIANPGHLILKAAHPSPLSAANGFFGCRHFSMANEFLRRNGEGEIDWRLD